nr:hypothetical protein [Tanacetum cinerariifolium]
MHVLSVVIPHIETNGLCFVFTRGESMARSFSIVTCTSFPPNGYQENDRYMLNRRRPCSYELIRLTAMLLYAFLFQG